MPEGVPREVDCAALPRRAKHLRQRVLQTRCASLIASCTPTSPRVSGIAGTRSRTPRSRPPNVQADDLPPTGVMHHLGDHHAFPSDAAIVTASPPSRQRTHTGSGPQAAGSETPAPDQPGRRRSTDLAARDPQAELVDAAGRDPRHIPDTNACSERFRGSKKDRESCCPRDRTDSCGPDFRPAARCEASWPSREGCRSLRVPGERDRARVGRRYGRSRPQRLALPRTRTSACCSCANPNAGQHRPASRTARAVTAKPGRPVVLRAATEMKGGRSVQRGCGARD